MTVIVSRGDRRKKLKRLQEAIAAAYSPEQLKMLLYYDLQRNMDDFVSINANKTEIIFQVIVTAERDGWLLDFVKAAYEEQPLVPNLKKLYQELQPIMDAADMDLYQVRLLRRGSALVNRQNLRTALKLLADDYSRILLVDGAPTSGKTYTMQLISFLSERGELGKTARIDLAELAALVAKDSEVSAKDKGVSARVIGKDIIYRLRLKGMPSAQNEQESRWVRSFCSWLAGELNGADTLHWIVIDHFDRALLTEAARALIEGLAVPIYTDYPMLRLVLISYDRADLRSMVKGGNVEHEDIPPIDEEDLEKDLTTYFALEYQGRMTRQGITYDNVDISNSVARVMHQVDRDKPCWLEDLGHAVAAEASRIVP